ncbi:MAG: glycosyltransferase family 2 protein [Roseovarius sp.]
MCVNNEQDTIVNQLRYHHYMGVTGAYVYLDHCTDATADLLQQFNWVTAIEWSRPPDCAGLPAHQVTCATDAYRRARDDGFDWLMHIDPDEYAWADPLAEGPAKMGGLRRMLHQVHPETDLVHLVPCEVLPERNLGRDPFWEQCYFQTADQLVQRDVLDPISGDLKNLSKWAGHKIGKSIVRTNCDAEPVWAHSWKRANVGRDEESLKTEQRGFHYHFVFMGARLWFEKYRKLAWEPDTWITGGKVPFPKQAWKDAARRFSFDQAEEYYERWVAMDRTELNKLCIRGEVVYDTRLRDTMRALVNG